MTSPEAALDPLFTGPASELARLGQRKAQGRACRVVGVDGAGWGVQKSRTAQYYQGRLPKTSDAGRAHPENGGAEPVTLGLLSVREQINGKIVSRFKPLGATQMSTAPVKFDASIETPEPDEAETSRNISQTLLQISQATLKDGGKALRSVHAKTHGLLKGELEIADDLPPEFAQGLFAVPGKYSVVIRLSTIPGDMLDDNVSLPRGLALKVMSVKGDRLDGAGADATQDFVLVNAPAFAVPTAKAFLANLKLLAKTTDKAEGLKRVLSATLRGLEGIVEAVGHESPALISLGGHARTNILGETFYSQAAIRFGDYIAKISLKPASVELEALKNASLNTRSPNMIRDAVTNFFRQNSAVWELQAQLCLDLATMPVEDSSKRWPEDESPFVTIAHVTADAQDAWLDENIREVDECMAFSPWNGLKLHQPLGSIMRVRKEAYKTSAEFRRSHNGCPIMQPG